jgi:hypothetical protein
VIADSWRSMRPWARALAGTVAAVIGLNLLIAMVNLATGGSAPGGPTSSSYATGDDGLAAYAELLTRRGHPVERLRTSLDRAELDPSATLVLADPQPLTAVEARVVATFVAAGGRLIAAGSSAAPLVAALAGEEIDWEAAEVGEARPLAPVPETAAIGTVETGGRGAWARAGAALPVLGDDNDVLALVAPVAGGRLVALADASPLQNRFLARADNAAFGLAAAGGAGRPVRFAEAQHGYGRGTGLRAVPARWRWAVVGGFLAAVVWMWSRGRRLGPPDELERVEAPARRAYVEAMAAALARTRQPDVAIAPLQERARRRLAERAGLPGDASNEVLRHAAVQQIGMSEADVDAVLRPCRTTADVIAVGRVAAALGRRPS